MRPKSSQCASLRPAGYIRYQSFAVVAVRKIRRGRHLGSFPFVAVLETQQSTTPAPVERTKLPVPASHHADPKQRGLKVTILVISKELQECISMDPLEVIGFAGNKDRGGIEAFPFIACGQA